MKPSINCINLIKHYEGFKAQPYLCPANVVTIGYGTTVYENGKKVRLNDPAITEADAVKLLMNDVEVFASQVNKLVRVPIPQNLFDALVSFCYNLGDGALKQSTLLKLINQNIVVTQPGTWKKQIATEFNKWIKAKVKGVLKILPGLVARRNSEALLATDGVLKFFN